MVAALSDPSGGVRAPLDVIKRTATGTVSSMTIAMTIDRSAG